MSDEDNKPMEIDNDDGGAPVHQEFDVSLLGRVSDNIAIRYGPIMENAIFDIAMYCKLYLIEQKKILNTKMQKLAFGEPVDGMSQEEVPDSLGKHYMFNIYHLTSNIPKL